LAAATAAPDVFIGERWLDWVASAGSSAAFATHMRVERWALDELAMSGRLFVDVVEKLYREDQFAAGTLLLGAQRVHPAELTPVPVLTVIEPQSRVVPEASSLGLLLDAPIKDLRVLTYEWDHGVALRHVGALVGTSAHRTLWPRIITWVIEHWS
jgi:polyhydroxyalkanoate synthase